MELTVGLEGEKRETVSPMNTAIYMGSGSSQVYATPCLITLLEAAAVAAVDAHLEEGYSTVGTDLHVQHVSATPMGMTVTAKATLTQIDNRRLIFTVEAYDEAGLVGKGTHERFIIQNEKFMAKASAKLSLCK